MKDYTQIIIAIGYTLVFMGAALLIAAIAAIVSL
jgi:hypothetical protein